MADRCGLVPDSDNCLRPVTVYIEWREDMIEYAAFGCEHHAEMMREGKRLTEYSGVPFVTRLRPA